MRIDVAGVLPMFGTDSYVAGRGCLHDGASRAVCGPPDAHRRLGIWHLPESELEYVRGMFVPDGVEFNVPPTAG